MSTLLVIGGTGFFGKSILSAYRQGVLKEWSIDRLIIMARHTGRLVSEVPELVTAELELISADIGVTDFLPDADIIIHAAASTDARNYLQQPNAERLNIQAATVNFSRLARLSQHKAKIVYVSSGAVYGVQPSGLANISELHPLESLEGIAEHKRDYATAKRDSEEIMRRLGEYGAAVSIARCFAFVGPFLPRDQHFAIGNFIEDGLNGRSIRVRAKNPVFRSYLHSLDLVRWLMTMAETANPNVPIYNVGSDQGYNLIDVAEMVGSFFDVEVQADEASAGVVDRYVPSVERAKRELGLSVRLGLHEAIASTVEAIKQRERLN